MALLLASVGASPASVLLTLDISDPSAVVITGTGDFPSLSATFDQNEGFSLMEFFTGSPISASGPALASTLTLGVGRDGVAGSETGTGHTFLSFYGSEIGGLFYLSEDAPAFEGQLTLDLSRDLGVLPEPGLTGSIFTGGSYFSTPSTPFGEYVVLGAVPLPGGLSFLLAGAFALAALSRRRHRRG